LSKLVKKIRTNFSPKLGIYTLISTKHNIKFSGGSTMLKYPTHSPKIVENSLAYKRVYKNLRLKFF
jgi:hypothetical protein